MMDLLDNKAKETSYSNFKLIFGNRPWDIDRGF